MGKIKKIEDQNTTPVKMGEDLSEFANEVLKVVRSYEELTIDQLLCGLCIVVGKVYALCLHAEPHKKELFKKIIRENIEIGQKKMSKRDWQ